jgi:formate dehydrogenase beta subunit
MTLVSAKVGMHSWAYDNDYDTREAREDAARGARPSASRVSDVEVELGFTAEQAADRSAALSQLRHPDALHRPALHRV